MADHLSLTAARLGDEAPRGIAGSTAYRYQRRELLEPDWRRFPGWRAVSVEQWRSPRWQRAHSIRNPRQLREVLGTLLGDEIYDDLALDQQKFATMPLLMPPQMLNTVAPHREPAGPGSLTEDFLSDPVRRYMLPLAGDRCAQWPSHPLAERDSLHEAQMWVAEGLTHRYPTKVLAELLATCPQYCGHCTRMDLVGPPTPGTDKRRFTAKPAARYPAMLDYLRANRTVRDVVVSGGDLGNLPWPRLESFLAELLTIDSIRDIRLASKALLTLPQHWLQQEVLDGLSRIARLAGRRGVGLAVHTHANTVQSITPLAAEAARAVLATGVRDVRNQGVLLRGVNDTPEALLDLCFALQDEAQVVPYYFYLCDMVPHSEHWRTPLHQAQRLQAALMGWLPGFATPRLVADVPDLGKRWVHQAADYDPVRGIARWTGADEHAQFHSYDPIDTLPPEGRAWWEARSRSATGS
ncbi:KamA family radical SAM protein [Kitasatospora kifunensis]|uniref:Lysine 2,3-aminomutase n=1 Tax=Kitasatospora kifunensis TaxID=58351 RepID=A0A7W7VSW5_KITKI|nr:lysine 2,3-aminomutase [Kitasatospora kifunensis]MBB4921074.1 lysine 2,3-aminomutase [Kitasatospora kifunensis]